MAQTQEKRQLIQIYPKRTQMLELTDKNFKAAIITLLKSVKENML